MASRRSRFTERVFVSRCSNSAYEIFSSGCEAPTLAVTVMAAISLRQAFAPRICAVSQSALLIVNLKQVQRGQLRLGASLEPLTTAWSGRARSHFVESGREVNADKVP
jgi:hypothetical protein